MKMDIKVNSDRVKYTENFIEALYEYQYTSTTREGNKITVGYELILLKIIAEKNCQCLPTRW